MYYQSGDILKTIDGYDFVIKRLLGEGGNGCVYLVD